MSSQKEVIIFVKETNMLKDIGICSLPSVSLALSTQPSPQDLTGKEALAHGKALVRYLSSFMAGAE